eukprot:CCRYP_002377-RI/>CCRYP_002377-RI protein AED:0.48 eAED:0.53 QI:201/0/0.5/1/0/0/2/0/66
MFQQMSVEASSSMAHDGRLRVVAASNKRELQKSRSADCPDVRFNVYRINNHKCEGRTGWGWDGGYG